MKLTFITGNPGKAKYLSTYFHLPVEQMMLDLVEIQSLNLNEIVEDKARRAYEMIKSPVLVEDVSLVFYALNTLPGPLIKWFLDSLGNDGLCRLLNGFDDRRAFAQVAYALCDENGVHIFTGSLEGTIAEQPRGTLSFGWSPIFIPKGYTKNLAELTDDERQEISMRKEALEKLSQFLKVAR